MSKFLLSQKRKKGKTTKKSRFSFKVSFFLLGLFVISIFGFSYFFYLAGGAQDKTSYNQSIKRGHVVSRTRKPGVVKDVVMTSYINPNNGKPYNNKTVFSVKDAIYADIGLTSAPKGTHIEYVRYYNGQYLDHGSVQLSQDNSTYISFEWQKTDKKSKVTTGPYLLKIYTNGRLETTVHYSIS